MSSIPRKRSKVRRFEAFLDFPQYMPDAANKAQLQYWYEQVKRTLKRINDELSTPLDELTTSVEELQTALDALTATVEAIQSSPSTPSGEQCCDELRAAIVLLQNRVTVLESAPPGGISGVGVLDEGAALGLATQFDFVGAGVTAVVSGGVATVTVPGLDLTGTFDIDDGDGVVPGTHIMDDGSP